MRPSGRSTEGSRVRGAQHPAINEGDNGTPSRHPVAYRQQQVDVPLHQQRNR